MFKKISFLVLSLAFLPGNAFAAIKTEYVTYSAGDVTMEGYMAYDDAIKTSQPGILIVHDWMGLGQFAKDKAEQLAKQGYVAFAADVYGKGIRPQNAAEAGQLATKYKGNRPLLRSHIRAAYDKLTGFEKVDKNKILVMGYCFGGTTALELARSGAQLAATVSFHGGLSTPTPDDAKNIKGRVLALHGADAPYVPPVEVQNFKDEMKKAGVELKFISYPGAVHAFTNPAAGNDNSKGAAYNTEADKNSWIEFQKFLKEVF